MATVETPATERAADSSELAGFGYKQELDRSLGSFSSFAAGFSYISILTGVTALFGFGYLNAGPGVWWTWPVVVGGQILVALCFMEMAAQYPIAGSVYQWSKQLVGGFTSWMTGWIYIVGAIVTIAAVAVDWQVVLPQITTKFQILGSSADAGPHDAPRAARRTRCCSGRSWSASRRSINMLGVKLMARINNVGVAAELVGSTLLIILLLFHLHQPPSVIAHSYGYGAGHPWGYFGALLDRRPAERVRDVRVRHRRDARRGDQQPAQARPAGDHPRDRGRRHDRRPGDPARDHVEQEHRRQEHRTARPAVRDQERVRQHHRERVPRRHGARDLRLLPGGAGGHDPDAVLDGARQPAAVRLAGRPRLGPIARCRSCPRW